MDINRIRLGLTYIFSESDRVDKESKLQLINFIENASLHQLKALALDGQFIKDESLDEVSRSILDDRFEVSEHIIKSIRKASLMALEEIVKKKFH